MLQTHDKGRHFPIAILSTPGGDYLAKTVDQQLRYLFHEGGQPSPDTFIRKCENFRFQNGEGKGVLYDSIRGTDLYIFCDPGNYGVTYERHGVISPMSPDEHFMDLKRLLGAAKNMSQRTTVVMPLLYESRQHKMKGRESLDCALALQEIVSLGVETVMTIDAHNSHVMNAIPMHGMENLHATYQLILAFLERTKGKVNISPDDLLVCSPDLGGMERARYFAEHFRVHLSGFYKVRDLTRVVNGKNPIIEHKFLGSDVKGKNILVVDDMLASGGSLLEVCRELKGLGAKDIYLSVSYALFSGGFEEYEQAFKEGLFTCLFGTNATYVPDALADNEWFVEVDVTNFIATFIHTFNRDGSITKLLDSTSKINRLLGLSLPNR
ncbi:MAG: ribose-phosphate diphosphokinase [Lentisphaeria bacterium]|nr:ribose-phosphate diphosphokinase [Lentisphaeria bacterium]